MEEAVGSQIGHIPILELHHIGGRHHFGEVWLSIALTQELNPEKQHYAISGQQVHHYLFQVWPVGKA